MKRPSWSSPERVTNIGSFVPMGLGAGIPALHQTEASHEGNRWIAIRKKGHSD